MIDKYIEDMNIEEKVSVLEKYCSGTPCRNCAIRKEALSKGISGCIEYVNIEASEKEEKLNRGLLAIGICSSADKEVNTEEAGDFLWE